MSILDRILEEKRREVERRRREEPLERLEERARAAPPPRGFRRALESAGGSASGPRIVAEIKKASPSRGLIRADFDPVAIARAYERGGAAAISVLTDEPFFQGTLAHLRAVREAVDLPLLRKDFTIDPYQIHEARAAGADAVLLIVAALGDDDLASLHAASRDLGMDALVEVHDEDELARAARIEPELVGVNNRDLATFEVSLETTRRLLPLRPAGALMVSESGFFEREEIDRMREWGTDAFLIGESLMRAGDPGEALAALTAEGAP